MSEEEIKELKNNFSELYHVNPSFLDLIIDKESFYNYLESTGIENINRGSVNEPNFNLGIGDSDTLITFKMYEEIKIISDKALNIINIFKEKFEILETKSYDNYEFMEILGYKNNINLLNKSLKILIRNSTNRSDKKSKKTVYWVYQINDICDNNFNVRTYLTDVLYAKNGHPTGLNISSEIDNDFYKVHIEHLK